MYMKSFRGLSEMTQLYGHDDNAMNSHTTATETSLREVSVYDAIGLRLAHDLTQIIPGQFKGRLFQRGHMITEADIPKLLDIGKEHIYVMELGSLDLHEDDAAKLMADALMDEQLLRNEPHEGKVSVKAHIAGVAKIAKEVVDAVNAIGEIALATIVTNKVVKQGGQLAATRAIPLIVSKEKIKQVESIATQYREKYGVAPISVVPLPARRIGLLTTGSEVYNGRIKDKFGPAVQAKLEALGSTVVEQRFATDDRAKIVEEIQYLQAKGYDMIIVTGGMSVDPDDRTPAAIKATGAHIVSYGTPMLPGSMLLIAYLQDIAIIGLPGCVMHDPYTSFDVFLPRLLLGEKIEKEDVIALGYGGLLGC